MSGRGNRQVARHKGAPQGRRRQAQVPQRRPSQVIYNNYQIINYYSRGYQSREHALQCPHVQRAISTHGITRELNSFLGLLASGLTIFASLATLGMM